MSVAGIVCEYNPFHNGHLHHIKETRRITRCNTLIAVMSGHFVQRGEPAIIDKWERTKAALAHGVDLVVELPFPYAVQSADFFAQGAIQTLALAGCSDVVFGSECNDLTQLREHLNVDMTIVHQRQREDGCSLAYAYGEHTQLLNSNDILGVAYLKAAQQTDLVLRSIQRTNHYHDTTLTSAIASATAIRTAVAQNEEVTHTTPMHNLTSAFHIQHYYPYLQMLLRTLPPAYLATIFLMDEGMEHLLMKQAGIHTAYTGFIEACISKRYTRSRIQRALMHLLTQTSRAEVNALGELQHIRILGFNATGKAHLASLADSACIIASKFNQIPPAYRAIELRAAYAYTVPLSLPKRQELIQKELRSMVNAQ